MPNRTGDVELESGSPWDSEQGVRVIIEAPEMGEIPDFRFWVVGPATFCEVRGTTLKTEHVNLNLTCSISPFEF